MDDLKEFRAAKADYCAISPKGILIVIVSYNAKHLMQENIRSIRQTVPEGCYKIIVVDNASEDGIVQWLAEQQDILLVANRENIGFGPACNQGVESVQGTEYETWDIFFLNNDTRLTDNALYFLKKALYSADDVGATGSISNYAGNRQQINVEFDRVEDYVRFGIRNNQPREGSCEERVRLSGFAMLVKRSVWNMIGRFDPDFAPGYFEDDALSMDITKAGYRLLLVHNSFIYHAGSQSFAKTANYEQLLIDHRELFIRKYGFDVMKYAYAEEAVIMQLPYAQQDSFALLQIGCGLGADLKAVRTRYPKSRTMGFAAEKELCDIACHTEVVYSDISELAATFSEAYFDALLVEPNALESLNQAERQTVAGLCKQGAVLLVKNPAYADFPFEEIKLIVWDLDNTLWHGILSEGKVTFPKEHIMLIKQLADCGIVNSISSKNEREQAENELAEYDIADFFVFNNINWEEKGNQLLDKITLMGLRQENVLFVDDDARNLEQARYVAPCLMTADPGIIPYLITYYGKMVPKDISHERLHRYQILEKKTKVRRNFGSPEQFLYDSDIHVTINRNCLEELDRICELTARTNQLNYTKNRDSKELLTRLLTNDWNDVGYVRARDRFGDYGIVGFFCYNTREKKMEHFLFSCRVLGMGIEQFVYNKLGCPDFAVAEPVAVRLEQEKVVPWISEDTDKEIVQDGVKENRVRVLLKGPCDMSAIEPYLSGGNITTEFTYVNEKGFVTASQNHTMHVCESRELSAEALNEIIQEVPFITSGDFETKIFDEKYHVICLSLLPDLSAGLYKNRKTGYYISFGSRNYSLTDPVCQKRFIRKEIQGHDFDFTQEILDRFASEWDFVGSTPLEMLLRNLDYIYENVPGNPLVIILLGSEIDYEGENEEFAGLAEVYRETNPIIRQYAQDHDRIRIIDPTEFIQSQEDFEDCVNHFSRRVYYEIAGKICEFINEKVKEMAKKR